jgi:hypothetical protein
VVQPRVEQAGEHRGHERDERDPPRRVHQLVQHRIGVEAAVEDGGGGVDRAADRDRQAADVRERHRT